MIRCFAMAVFLSSALAAPASDPLDTWHWRTPLPQGYSLNGAAVTANLRVAVGELGTILLSTDGVDWIMTTAPVVTNLNAVCFTQNGIVAVGDGGTILTSTTGTSWSLQESPTTNHLHSVTTGNGLIVAVGGRGTVTTSPTGSSWTLRNSQFGANVDLVDVSFGDGRFVTVGRAFHEDFIYGISAASPDGINWQTANGQGPFESVVFGNGVFLATTGSQFAIGRDGLQWAHYYLGTATNASDLAFADGQFIAASWRGVLYSSNGTNWTVVAGTSGDFRRIAIGEGHGVAVGRVGRLASSMNLIDWRMISSGPDGYLRAMTFGNGRFVGVSGPFIYTSLGGQTWTSQRIGSSSLPSVGLNAVAYGKGIFIAVGGPYFPLTNMVSADGVTWSPLRIPETNALTAIAFVNDRFVACGEAGSVYESADGTNWTSHLVSAGVGLGAIAYGNGRYVVAGVGAIYASPDLENWTYRGGTNVNWTSLAYGNGMFVCAGIVLYGRSGVPALRSFDGLAWEPASKYPAFIADIAFGRGIFVGGANDGIVTSTNGLDWVLRKNPLFTLAQTVAFGLETFVVNRFEGGIVQSDPVVPLVQLGAPVLANGQFQWSIVNGATGSTYLIQSSGDLEDWTDETTITPLQFPFALTNQASLPSRFYRAVGQ